MLKKSKKPAPQTIKKILVDDILGLIDGMAITEISPFLSSLMDEGKFTDEERSKAFFNVDYWDDRSLQIATTTLETEDAYDARVAKWQKRNDELEASDRATYEKLKKKFDR